MGKKRPNKKQIAKWEKRDLTRGVQDVIRIALQGAFGRKDAPPHTSLYDHGRAALSILLCTNEIPRERSALIGFIAKNAGRIKEAATLMADARGEPSPVRQFNIEWRTRFKKAKALRDDKTVAVTTSQIAPRVLTPMSHVDVTLDAFLGTFEWRKLRMMALKQHGAKCQCCGATPATGAVMNVDHIKPRKRYPHLALELDNLQVLCHECNHGKGNWDQTDWRSR